MVSKNGRDITEKEGLTAIVLVGGNYNKVLLKKCLKSLLWVDEIVQVETSKIPGSFSQWRNWGAERAKFRWLLYLDSDEEIPSNLKNEILFAINNKLSTNSGYAFPRRNILLGREMHYGGWWPDYVLRLMKKESLIGWTGDLHEQPQIRGVIGKFVNPLIHTSHRSLAEMVAKTNAWSDIEAKLMFEACHPRMNLIRFVSAAFREFWYRGIIKMGFLDGTEGIIEIIYQTFSRLISYMKLWELQEKNSNTKNVNSAK